MKNFEIKQDLDTRDNSDLYLLVFERMEKSDFDLLSKELKKHKIYYSGFKKGFISKAFISKDIIIDILKDIDFNNQKTKKETTTRVEYKKLLSDYLSLDEIKEKVTEYYNNNPQFFKRSDDPEKEKNDYIKYNIEKYSNAYGKNDYYNKLEHIREAIIHKSLGHELKTLYTNNRTLTYYMIWDLLPTIKGLKTVDTWYYSVWGYDQTNTDIAWMLNTKLWGLDVLVEETVGKYLLKRINQNQFSDGCRYFSKGEGNPQRIREEDASYTGQYR